MLLHAAKHLPPLFPLFPALQEPAFDVLTDLLEVEDSCKIVARNLRPVAKGKYAWKIGDLLTQLLGEEGLGEVVGGLLDVLRGPDGSGGFSKGMDDDIRLLLIEFPVSISTTAPSLRQRSSEG